MWTRSEVKNDAKRILARCYPAALLVSLVFALLSGGMTNGRATVQGTREMVYDINLDKVGDAADDAGQFSDTLKERLPFLPGILARIAGMGFGLLLLSFSLLFFLLSLAVKILVTNPVEVGARRFFMSSRERATRLNALLYAFSSGNYWNVVKILFIRDVKIFLWSLLLVIPGIIKSYEYQMVPYILAENPGISTAEAFQLTRDMTYGEKLNLFVLDVSFFPWMLLSSFTCGMIGLFWLNPYAMATKAEVYALFRRNCLNTGRTNSYVLPGF